MAKSDKVTGIVAEGRSVDLDGQVYGPGKKVVLSAADAASLRASGFLADDGGAASGDDVAVSRAAKSGDTGKSVKKDADTGVSDAGPGAATSESGGAADPSGDQG